MNMKRLVMTWTLAALLSAVGLQAQNTPAHAKQLYKWLIEGPTDSLHVHMSTEMQKGLPLEALNGFMRQLEAQLGKYTDNGDWKTQATAKGTIYATPMNFERGHLNCMITLGADGKMIGLWLAPMNKPREVELVNNSVITEEAVEVVTGKYKLPGILTLPVGVEHAPIAVLVHGSGGHDRDETVGPNKPFRDLAHQLAMRGIGVLRYDKRTFVYTNPADYEGGLGIDQEVTEDALSAITLAAGRSNKVFVVGHSLGAYMAPRIAGRAPQLSGIVMLAGIARNFEDVIVDQFEYLAGFPDNGITPEAVEKVKLQAANVKKLGTPAYDDAVGTPLDQPKHYWQSVNDYKHREDIAKLKMPILVVQGERDYQVTMQDFDLWRKILKRKKKATFKSYPALNHLLHEGSGKATPAEYEKEGKMPAYVADDIAAWILKQ